MYDETKTHDVPILPLLLSLDTEIAGMRDDYVAGDLQYDPLGFCPDDDEDFITMRTKELNNGRMAMIAVIGIIAQEIVTGVPIVKSIFG